MPEEETQRATRLGDGEGLEIAEPEDFGIRRGSNDAELLPVKQRIPGTDKAIRVKPILPGTYQQYYDVLETPEADIEKIAELWEEHVVEGIGSSITVEQVQELGEVPMPHGYIAGINQAIKNSAGHQVFRKVQDQKEEEIQKQLDLLNQLDENALESLAQTLISDDSQQEE